MCIFIEQELPMKQKLNTSILIIVALITVLATLIHGSIADISIFHGMILHPVFLLAGLSLFALVKEQRSSD
jgi:hypothetical protein